MFSGEKSVSKRGLYKTEFILIPTRKLNILQNSTEIQAKIMSSLYRHKLCGEGVCATNEGSSL